MKFMIILDHPREESFNRAVAERVRKTLGTEGHQVDFLNLHAENFDPVLRSGDLEVYTRGEYRDPLVGEYQKRISDSDHLIFIFPVWWEAMPALMKGFFDKVFLPGWAFSEADAAPLLSHISGATVISTMGAPEVIHTSVESVLCRGILGFCGIRDTQWLNITNLGNRSAEEREAWMAGIDRHLRGLG